MILKIITILIASLLIKNTNCIRGSTQLTDANFIDLKQSIKHQNVLLYFGSKNCSKCNDHKQFIDRLSNLIIKNNLQDEIKIMDVETSLEESNDLTYYFDINQVPSYLYFANGGVYSFPQNFEYGTDGIYYFITEGYKQRLVEPYFQGPSIVKNVRKVIYEMYYKFERQIQSQIIDLEFVQFTCILGIPFLGLLLTPFLQRKKN